MKNKLFLAGLLAAGLVLTGCGNNPTTPDNGGNEGGNEGDNGGEVTPPPAEAENKFLEGTFTDFGGGVVNFYLTDLKNCVLDCSTNQGGSFDTWFDATGTYKIENGVLTATLTTKEIQTERGPMPAQTSTLTATQTETGIEVEYTMKGQRDVPCAFETQQWLYINDIANGEFSDFGGGVTAVRINNLKDVTFDVTTNQGGAFDTWFDATGSDLKVVDGVLTATLTTKEIQTDRGPMPAQSSVLTLNNGDNGAITGDYTMKGQKEIPVVLEGTWENTWNPAE